MKAKIHNNLEVKLLSQDVFHAISDYWNYQVNLMAINRFGYTWRDIRK